MENVKKQEIVKPVNWLKFLNGIWGDDTRSIELLQEWFGYCLTADTSQQKMMLISGPPRSGKSTITSILRLLVGAENYQVATMSSLAANFGLAEFIGKSVACVGDLRICEDDAPLIVSRLLAISGEQELVIDKQCEASCSLKLPTRLIFEVNGLPRLGAAAAVLADRFVVLELSKSFYGGHDDVDYVALFKTELTGIAQWAAQGAKRLRKRGNFTALAGSVDAIKELKK